MMGRFFEGGVRFKITDNNYGISYEKQKEKSFYPEVKSQKIVLVVYKNARVFSLWFSNELRVLLTGTGVLTEQIG